MRRHHPARLLVVVLLSALITACSGGVQEGRIAEQQDTLLGPGQAFYWSGDYDQAREVWNATLERAREEGDSLGVANLLTWLGFAAMRTMDYGEARELGEAALDLKLSLGDTSGIARSYNALALLAEAEGRLFDAQRLYEQARAAAAATDEKDLKGAVAGNLGLIYAYLGDLEKAAAMLGEMYGAGKAVGDRRLEANALTNLAMVSIWSGDPGAAIAPLDRALGLYGELEYPLGEQYALGQLATARTAMGEYEPALAALDSALVLARRHGMRDQEAENLGILGGLYADLGDPRRALRYLDRAAQLAGEMEMDAERGNILRRSALVRYSLGSTDRALSDARAALSAHHAAGETFEEIDDLIVLAELHGRNGDSAEAESMLRRARILAQQVDARSVHSAVALAEARRAEQVGDPRRILRAVETIHAEAIPADFRTQVESSMLAARAYSSLELPDSAAVAAGEALHALERVRGSLVSDELRSSFTAASASVYGDVVLGLLQLDRTEEAFAVADAARSRELLERLSRAGESAGARRDNDPLAGPEELARAELLLHRIDALLSQLREIEITPPRERGSGVGSTSIDITDRIDRLREEYEALTIRAAQRYPRSSVMLGAVRTDGSSVQAALAPDEVLLHYTLTAEELVIFAVRSDRFESIRVPVAARDLASRIRLLRELWGSREGAHDAGLPVAQGLHALLIAPAAEAGLLDGVDRLVIVPHGILEQLPFAALHDRGTQRFLVENYLISYLRSANLLPALRAQTSPSPALARGVSAFAPFPTALPGTRAEAAEASRSGPRARLFVERRATEREVRRSLETSEVVHIASHGVLNARNPMFSRIELVRGSRGDSADDGRLEVHEVLRMRVNSSLVVLSGCETGVAEDWSGDPLRPAGVATLGQAFLHAGARNVMATLWRIDDEGSAKLVGGIYRNMEDGDAARGLALAQRRLIREQEFASPYYWAGFVLVGEGRLAAPQPPFRTAAASRN